MFLLQLHIYLFRYRASSGLYINKLRLDRVSVQRLQIYRSFSFMIPSFRSVDATQMFETALERFCKKFRQFFENVGHYCSTYLDQRVRAYVSIFRLVNRRPQRVKLHVKVKLPKTSNRYDIASDLNVFIFTERQGPSKFQGFWICCILFLEFLSRT